MANFAKSPVPRFSVEVYQNAYLPEGGREVNAIVTVTTIYYGADPETVAGFITTPLETAIAQANGIDYMTSVSRTSVSTITANLRLNYDSDKALTEITTKVSSVLNQLPPESQQPAPRSQHEVSSQHGEPAKQHGDPSKQQSPPASQHGEPAKQQAEPS